MRAVDLQWYHRDAGRVSPRLDPEIPMLRTIVVPLDGSPLAERALPVAFDIARRNGGAVHLVRAYEPLAIVIPSMEGVLSPVHAEIDLEARGRAKGYLDGLAGKLGASWGVPATPHLVDGRPSTAITEVAESVNADLVVMTTHGHGGFAPDWLGSVADSVIRHSHRPVLTFPTNGPPSDAPFVPKHIMVTLDGSQHAESILGPARDLALTFGATLQLVRVVLPYIPLDVSSILTAEPLDPLGVSIDADRAKQALDYVVARMESEGVPTSGMVRVSVSPTSELRAHVRETDPDCIAVATQGHGFSRVFLGSIADKLLRTAGRPVLVMRPQRPSREGQRA